MGLSPGEKSLRLAGGCTSSRPMSMMPSSASIESPANVEVQESLTIPPADVTDIDCIRQGMFAFCREQANRAENKGLQAQSTDKSIFATAIKR